MKSINKNTLRVDVCQRIRESIINNELKPGERIVETQIAKQLGVSQSPVREAIRELEHMGLIENKPFLGCFVKKLTKKDIVDAYKLRASLEMLAASEAAKNITDDQLAEMEELIEKMKAAAKDKDVNEFVELDIAFHKMIVKISDNALLEKMWDMVNLSQWTFITTKISERSLPELADRHLDIFMSLKNRDKEEAWKCMKVHIEELGDEVISKINYQEHDSQS